MGTTFSFPQSVLEATLTTHHIICIYCFCINIPMNQFLMEVLRSMRIFLFICFTEKINLSRMAVGQVALADSHGPSPCPPHSFLSFPLPSPPSVPPSPSLFFFLSFLPFFKTESQCVAQGDLELTILLPQPRY